MKPSRTDRLWVWLWAQSKRLLFWGIGGGLGIVIIGMGVWQLFFTGDSRRFLPGITSLGHHQFEIQCYRCHEGFSRGVSNQACLECHRAQWQQQDVHSPALWDLPQHQPQLALLNAKQCATCHREHRANLLPNPFGLSNVTVEVHFCQTCHSNILTHSNHQGFQFNQCITCHQYHHDAAMQANYLKPHQQEADTVTTGRTPINNLLHYYRQTAQHDLEPLTQAQHDAPEHSHFNLVLTDWEKSSHAKTGINCRACHQPPHRDPPAMWDETPPPDYCQACHQTELQGFQAGAHGIRPTLGLSPLQTAEANLPMKALVKSRTLNCTACHAAHAFNRSQAAVEACLDCHQDQHSRAYLTSPHYQLWQKQQAGTLPPGAGVSCATCHLPRTVYQQRVLVQHNISANLRDKKNMVSVCTVCHGLGFSLDSLATERIYQDNFSRKPAPPVPVKPLLEQLPAPSP